MSDGYFPAHKRRKTAARCQFAVLYMGARIFLHNRGPARNNHYRGGTRDRRSNNNADAFSLCSGGGGRRSNLRRRKRHRTGSFDKPAAATARINSDINALLQQPDIRELLARKGMVPAGGPPIALEIWSSGSCRAGSV